MLGVRVIKSSPTASVCWRVRTDPILERIVERKEALCPAIGEGGLESDDARVAPNACDARCFQPVFRRALQWSAVLSHHSIFEMDNLQSLFGCRLP